MRSILFLLPSARYNAHTTQLLSLLQGLRQQPVSIHVAILTADGPAAEVLERHNVALYRLGRKRFWDLRALVRSRQLIQDIKPDVIHAFGLPTLRFLNVAAGRPQSQLLVSSSLANPAAMRSLNLLDRWLLSRVDNVIVSGEHQAQCYQQAGVEVHKLAVLPPGHDFLAHPNGRHHPAEPFTITLVGPLEPEKGILDGLWATDVVRMIHPDVRIQVVGDGPELPRLQAFVHNVHMESSVEFLGAREKILPLLAQSSVVLVPSRDNCGQHVAIEAMACGRPVIASNVPVLREVIQEGVNGFLCRPGMKINFASRINELIDDPALHARMSDAAYTTVRRHFTLERMLDQYRRLCRPLAA